MHILKVRPADVFALWAKAGPLLRPAIAAHKGWWTERDVVLRLVQGQAALWLGVKDDVDAALVTEIEPGPQFRTAVISLFGAHDMTEVLAFLPEVEAWGRDMGAMRVEVRGREGWKRALAPFGYQPLYAAVGKELH